jgi:hypothetical protein
MLAAGKMMTGINNMNLPPFVFHFLLSGGSVTRITRLLGWQNATKRKSDVISAFCDKENSEKGG